MADQKQKKEGNTTHRSEAPKKRTKPPKYTGWKRAARYFYIALTVLSALVVAGYIAFHSFSAPPDVEKLGQEDKTEGGKVVNVVRTRPPTPTTIITTNPDTGEVMEYDAEIPGLSSERKKEFYTFLLVGQDQTGGTTWVGNTDTMMLVAYNVPDQNLAIMSLPRDTYVRYLGNTVLLNSVYSRGGGGKNGMKRLKEEVSELTGVYPDFYVMVQWEAIGELVDAIGGVDFEVPFDMYYNDKSQNFIINLKKGMQTLSGSKVMQLIRYRQNSIGDTGKKDTHYGYADGDLGRIKTQQGVMKAIIKKCLQPDVLLPKLGNYIDVFQRNVETDLTVGNMTYFGKSAISGLDMDNVITVTLPNVSAGDGHVLPIGSKLVTLINESFNPYKSNIQRYELDLVDGVVKATKSPAAGASTLPGTSAGPGASAVPGTSAAPGASAVPGTSTAPVASAVPGGDPDSSISPRPSSVAGPDSSEHPKVTEDPNAPLLPGGVTPQPSSNPKFTDSSKPAGSEKPAGSDNPTVSDRPVEEERPFVSEKPADVEKPVASEKPAGNEPTAPREVSPSTVAENTPAPPAATPAPVPPPTAAPLPPPVSDEGTEEEPLLPP